MEHIINRTSRYVTSSKSIIRNIIQKNGIKSLTPDQKRALMGGTLNIDTINRIEGNQSELKNMLNSIGYFGINSQNKQWESGDIFFKEDYQRIASISKILISSFGEISLPIPTETYYFESLNKIEKNNLTAENFYNEVINNYRYCGDYECGG